MPNQRHVFLNFFISSTLFFQIITCYPLDNLSEQVDLKNETRFPNGTVVGKYTYYDSEGNPINVKYYADDSSYGVELNSVKVVNATRDDALWKISSLDTPKGAMPFIETPLVFDNSDEKLKKNYIDNEKTRNAIKQTKNSDYDTFYRTDIGGLNEKEKVRVYVGREKKKNIKRASDNYQAANYCDRY